MSNYYEKPLSDTEFVELGELMAETEGGDERKGGDADDDENPEENRLHGVTSRKCQCQCDAS